LVFAIGQPGDQKPPSLVCHNPSPEACSLDVHDHAIKPTLGACIHDLSEHRCPQRKRSPLRVQTRSGKQNERAEDDCVPECHW
jgi:hypothetical protein